MEGALEVMIEKILSMEKLKILMLSTILKNEQKSQKYSKDSEIEIFQDLEDMEIDILEQIRD